MKRYFLLFCLMISTLFATSQAVTLCFTGTDLNGYNVPFDSVVVTNVTRGWTETLVYPDTTLVLSRLGVGEIAPDQAGITSIFPNPFDAFANVGFGLAEAGRVGIRVVGIDGVMKVSWEGYLSSGIHQVRIGLSRPQMALVIIDTEKDRYVGKLLQIGYGGNDAIELNDEPGDKPECASRAVRSDRLESYGGFEPGDYMSFMGVCTSPDGEVVVSRTITRAIFGDETIALEFQVNSLPPVGIVFDGDILA